MRRLKTYSAQTGYVYQYFYEGQCPFRDAAETGLEFVFSICADRKHYHPTGIFISDEAIRTWQGAHQRQLSSNELYAVAKIALFQAFDERPTPAQMKTDVRVRPADMETILETLDL